MVRLRPPSSELCVKCKGRLLCGLDHCPILKQRELVRERRVSRNVTAPSPPSVFVSWRRYPKVEIGPVIAFSSPENFENPRVLKKLDINEVLALRRESLMAVKRTDALSAVDPSYDLIAVQEVAMGKIPEVHVILKKDVVIKLGFDSGLGPTGPKCDAKKIDTDAKTDRDVEKLYYDDVPAEEGVIHLYEKGKDVYDLYRYLSAGILGVQRRRRFVPTRWAITAVDTIVSRHLFSKIPRDKTVEKILLFESHLFDNHFYIILFPRPWAFEMLEAWAPGSPWNPGKRVKIISEREIRKEVREPAIGGSFHAAKLAVLEYLSKKRFVASVVVIREVGKGYFAPLGVWQVRENVRNAFLNEPKQFNSLKELENYLNKKLFIPFEKWAFESILLRSLQKTLFDFS